MGKKREVGSIWRAIFGDGEETPAQRDARALSRWSSGYKSKDYEKYIKPKEEARRKRWEEAEKQQSSYFSDSPQYKNAGQYLSTISQKIQVNINGKEIELSLMPYEGRGVYRKTLGPKIKHYCRPDNRKFMELVKEILTDYEMEYFHKKYNSYKVHCAGGKPVPFRKLFTSIETAKANT